MVEMQLIIDKKSKSVHVGIGQLGSGRLIQKQFSASQGTGCPAILYVNGFPSLCQSFRESAELSCTWNPDIHGGRLRSGQTAARPLLKGKLSSVDVVIGLGAFTFGNCVKDVVHGVTKSGNLENFLSILLKWIYIPFLYHSQVQIHLLNKCKTMNHKNL